MISDFPCRFFTYEITKRPKQLFIEENWQENITPMFIADWKRNNANLWDKYQSNICTLMDSIFLIGVDTLLLFQAIAANFHIRSQQHNFSCYFVGCFVVNPIHKVALSFFSHSCHKFDCVKWFVKMAEKCFGDKWTIFWSELGETTQFN